MVGVSYHELTAGQKPRHSAGERKQFLVICTIGAAVMLNAFINAGLFEEVVIKDDGIYRGGQYIHKLIEHRDYASTGGFFRNIRSNLKLEGEEDDDDKYDEDLYSVYIDLTKPYHDKGRFFTGILIDDSKADMKQRLLEKNANKSEKKIDDETDEQFERLDYEIDDLPSVRSAVASFPWTDGFVSGILNNYKVFPALHKYAKENLPEGSKFVVSTTCSRKKQMCTHYIPMIQQKDFLLGHKDSLEYEGHEEDQTMVDFELLWSDLKHIFTFKWINY